MHGLVWSSDLELGIEVIDEQHKRIFDYLEQIDHAIETGDTQEVHDVVQGVLDYTQSHLTFEEGLMEQAGYPCLDAHRKVHQAFAARIQRLERDLKQGRDTMAVARKVRSDLGLWLMNHIRRDDQDYVKHVKPIVAGSWIKRWRTRIFGG